MIVGVTKEIKADEYRVGLTPAGVKTLTDRGHTVLVEAGAGLGSRIDDAAYAAAGGRILPVAAVWEQADMIVKVKEPLECEYRYFKPGLLLFTYLHLAADKALTEALLQSKVVGLAYETVQPEDHSLPLLAPMSEVAGRMSVQVGAYLLTKQAGGAGMLMGGVAGVQRARVVIVGGGDTGNDCVGTCIRHGCKSVVQLEMMPKAPDRRTEHNPWPEWPRVCKTDYGQEEAIALFGADPRIYQTTVTEILRDEKGALTGVRTVKLTGDLKPVEGSEQTLKCELLLIAAGFLGPQDYVPAAFGVERTPRTCVQTAAGRYATSVPRVFTAGDMHRGQSLVVWAIQEGRAAAREVDEFLMGYTNLE